VYEGTEIVLDLKSGARWTARIRRRCSGSDLQIGYSRQHRVPRNSKAIGKQRQPICGSLAANPNRYAIDGLVGVD
jgi:hypothetical protein